MSHFSTQYHRLPSVEDNEEDLPPQVCHVGMREVEKGGRWNHIENLDQFFIRVYQYHQNDGFACSVLSDIMELVQYIFVVVFTSFLILCVDYHKLFNTKDVVISDCLHFHKVRNMDAAMAVCLAVAVIFWIIRFFRTVYHITKLWEIRAFFRDALKINERDLANMQWHDVQRKLIETQKEHQMCIHKESLTELDIYHRILRSKNYLVAMHNKSVIPCFFHFPFIGSRPFLTEGLKYNINLLLFRGPGCFFQDNWKLREEIKNPLNRHTLAESLAQRIFLVGAANFLLLPFILLWQVLYSFFNYAEMIKRSPTTFGARRWSVYSRLCLRHFNELDHEFQARLNKAYEPANKYLNTFTYPILAVIAQNVAFFAGAIFAVLTALTLYDQDILHAEHVLTTIAVLGLTIRCCYAFIPDENLVWCPEYLMKQVLSNIHYIPDNWKGKAHTNEVRKEFEYWFQYKIVGLLEDLLSPVVTPFVLCFSLKYRALDIVDFFRNFTVEVQGVGDVCSFAQLDVKKHGNPEWSTQGITDASQYDQAENGKTELSLLHFSMRNPNWKPSHQDTKHFINTIKENVQQEAMSMSGSLSNAGGSLGMDDSYRTNISLIGLPSIQPVNMAESMHAVLPPGSKEQQDAQAQFELNSSMLFMHKLHGQRAELSQGVSTGPSTLSWHRPSTSKEQHSVEMTPGHVWHRADVPREVTVPDELERPPVLIQPDDVPRTPTNLSWDGPDIAQEARGDLQSEPGAAGLTQDQQKQTHRRDEPV